MKSDLLRLREQYSPQFLDLVLQCHPKKPQLGVKVLCGKAEQLAVESDLSLEEAYRATYEAAAGRVAKRVALMAGAACKNR